ncbi:MAG: hypothetical protein B6D41_03750 [Chloroflexi bacterium UTCFX4]|jgi:hypothetical protein|nr:MAG: hypothetical protein B6D41_03750 [Chloroflexi bacterium UTCFX4]
MTTPNLNQSLDNLNHELNQAEATDKSQPVINDLKTQIQPLVEHPPADHSEDYQSLGERLNLALVDLDVDHPRLSAAIRVVLDELAAVGI